jgi:hypothetical protein
MMVDAPVFVAPSLPLNRPFDGERLGGGGTAAPTELPRAISDTEQTSATRRAESESNTDQRSSPNDAEIAAQARLLVARDAATSSTPIPVVDAGIGSGGGFAATVSPEALSGTGGAPSGQATSATVDDGDDGAITAAQFAQLRDQLEIQLSEGPSGMTLRSVDEFI